MFCMKKGFFLLGFMLVFASCKKGMDTCKEAICTMDFRSIGLVLQTPQGTAASVDYVQTYRGGQLLHTDVGVLSGNSWVVHLLDDSHRSKLNLNMNETLRVKVIKQGLVVKEVDVVALADCCHVNKVSGVDTLQVP